jgi:transposase
VATGWDLGAGQRREASGKFVSAWDASPNQAQPFWIVNRSKPVPYVAMSGATMGGKKIHGRKRHLLVDTHGLLLGVKVLAAEIRDRAGGQVLLTALRGHLPRLQVIWGDSGYAGDPFEQWVKQHLGVRFEIVKHPWTGLRGVWAPEGATIDWDKIMPKGFHVLPKRWVVERTNAWITHHRRLSRDFEGTHSTSRGLHLSGDVQDHGGPAGSFPFLNDLFLHTLSEKVVNNQNAPGSCCSLVAWT